MRRRAKQLIAMILFYVFAVGFAAWAVHHQDAMFWKYVGVAIAITGFLVVVVPQLCWLRQEWKEEDRAHRP